MAEAETKASMLDEIAYSGLILWYESGITVIGFDWAINCSNPLHPWSPLNIFKKFNSVQLIFMRILLKARNCAKCWRMYFLRKQILPSKLLRISYRVMANGCAWYCRVKVKNRALDSVQREPIGRNAGLHSWDAPPTVSVPHHHAHICTPHQHTP